MMKATASSTRLPRRMKFLNPVMPFSSVADSNGGQDGRTLVGDDR